MAGFRGRPLVAGILLAGLLSCDDGASTGGDSDGGRRSDGFIDNPGGTDSGGGGRTDLDGDVADMRTSFSGNREPCAENRDCASGWCVPFDDRLVCTRTCQQDGCEDDWGCHAVANSRPDVVFICFPPGNRLCGACLVDADCPNGACHDVDGQKVCGLGCDEANLCPRGYACGDDGQCAPTNGSCTCNDTNAGEDRLCENGNEFGTCLGREVCEPGSGWVGCSAQTPAAEICNAEDDDCNGFADDIVGLGEACTNEVDVEGEHLTCTGRLVCSAEAGPQPICTAPTPGAEICNFLDDDCDGETDEGFEQRGQVCVVGGGVCQRVGVFECSDDGAEVACSVVAGAPVPERCNGLDDDCDGTTDEDFVGLNGACEAGIGACRRAGALRCDAAGEGAACTAVAGDPSDERCDGLDNDCDGTSDEGFADLFAPCEQGVGACRRTGFRLCTEDGAGVTCTASPAAPGVETCNGVDDDCDGTADEGFPGVNLPCSDGVGRCLRPGVTVCSPDGAAVVCSVVAGAPVAELCNGLDDDCDGANDETFEDLDDVCTQGEGACARVGVRRCAPDGSATLCSARPADPRAEVCNGADDDCDGSADEDFPLKDTPCTAGAGLCARTGLNRCTPAGDATVCDVVAGEPAAEACDNFDNDCDGRTDEGFAGLNTPCTDGAGACRRVGITVCAPGGAGTACNATAAPPTAEICNGLDDDCDGATDEGFPDVLTACIVGRGACLRNGVRVCTPDGAATACNAVAGAASDETCNAEDDDCDGTTDEGFDGLGRGCVAGQGACRTNGVQVCSDDGLAVECDAADVPGGPEACNGVDDDCDGRADEGFAGLNTACQVGQGVCLARGVRTCSADGAAVVCDATAGVAGAETCNGLDDDCDGNLDEGFANLGRACNVGQGTCARSGVSVCAADGSGVTCDAVAAAPGVERCNGLDDDCDGTLDEGYANVGRACRSGQGACAADGVNVCSPDGAAVVCDAVPGAPVAERCNGIDDNCNGTVDEGFAGLNTACQVGQGVCLARGVRTCSPDGAAVVCDAAAGAPGVEICNGLDDDCDGTTDEGFAGLNTACNVGQGVCRAAGVRVCSPNGAAVVCDAVAGAPGAETCNGLDDDCDGRNDETFPGLNTACSAGQGVCRAAGVQVCSPNGAAVVCDAVAGAPRAETCNGQDDDCDGTLDEGFANLGRACQVGVGECLRTGVNLCAADGGSVVCDAVVGMPAAERCDARDNDCDGVADEGFVGLNNACTVGAGACLRQGVNLCDAGGAGVACSAQVGMPSAELCNAIDDDCDGRTDEDHPTLNRACEVGVGACRQVGVQVCQANGAGTQCDAVAGAPVAERCNGIDDDCDGRVDETFPNVGAACDAGVGDCRRGGVVVCTANGAGSACDAVAAAPAADVCDYRDNNCDGRVDENFVDAQNRYNRVTDCGACGADCNDQWAPNPAAFGVAPLCRVAGAVAQCGFTCLAGFLDADNVAENGCELAVDADAIYVSTPENGGVLAVGCGTVELPCASINLGLFRALDSGAARVLVSDGVYNEVIDLIDGIDLLGGHHRTTWRRAPDLNVTVISGGIINGDVNGYGVRAVNILSPTVLDGFVIRSATPASAGNSYGVYILDSGPGLTVRNNRVLPGDGGRGIAGTSGASGVPGVNGANGLAGFAAVNANSCQSNGGAGGVRVCGATTVSGGTGGRQTACPVVETQAGTGVTGSTARGGIGGPGGWHLVSNNNSTCSVSAGGPLDASPGVSGSSGADGAGGQGAVSSVGTGGAHWRGVNGNSGVSGVPGGGGGGGGAAAGVDVAWRAGDHYDIGSTGGGGGSGGCNGTSGQRGQAGGGSFSIYIHFTNGPASVGGVPTLTNNRLQRGVGGVGGDGGVGGGGGEGGAGGGGGARGAGLNMGFCAFVAGQGGVGGRGGHAGGGGGGQGGISTDIFVSNTDGVAIPYAAANTFLLPAATATGGRGGVGGTSSNTAIGLGTNGAVGLTATVSSLP